MLHQVRYQKQIIHPYVSVCVMVIRTMAIMALFSHHIMDGVIHTWVLVLAFCLSAIFLFYYGSYQYYYADGIYYQPYQNGYVVAVPPVGAEVPKLPRYARPVAINGQQYYELNGVYYKPYINPDNTQGYIIAGKDGVLNTSITAPIAPPPPAPVTNGQPMAQPAPSGPPVNAPAPVVGPPSAMPPVVADAPKIGDTVTVLPDGCKSVNVAGKTYFVSPADVYYEQAVDGNNVIYKVQGVPAGQKQ